MKYYIPFPSQKHLDSYNIKIGSIFQGFLYMAHFNGTEFVFYHLEYALKIPLVNIIVELSEMQLNKFIVTNIFDYDKIIKLKALL